MTISVRHGLEYRRLGDEGVILDPESGLFFRLSPRAAACWESLLQGAGTDDADALQELEKAGLIRNEGMSKVSPGHVAAPMLFVENRAFLECVCSIATLPTNKGQCTKSGCIWSDSSNTCVRP